VLISLVVFLGLGFLTLLFRTLRRVAPHFHAPPGTSIDIRRRVRRFAGFSFLIGLGSTMRSAAVDVLVISRYLEDADVALYAFATGIALMAFQYTPMANVGTILTPIMAREYSRTKDPERLVFFFQLSTKLALHTSVPLLVGLFIFLPNVITEIYQRPDYLPAVMVGRMFLGYMMVKILTRPFSIIYSTCERPDLSLYALFLLGLNLVLLFILVPRYGIFGAALSTCGLAPLYYVYHVVILRAFTGLRLSFPPLPLLRYAVNIAIAAVFGFLLQRHLNGLLLTLAGLGLFWLCYVLVAKTNRIFDEREKAVLGRTMGNLTILL
jgi:O-antigen/teichoic acid export membrane protein